MLIFHLEVGHIFAYFVIKNYGVETHGSYIERVAVYKTIGVGFHDFDGSTQGVGHIHHIHKCAGIERALEGFAFYGRIVDVNGIVGCATSGRRYI